MNRQLPRLFAGILVFGCLVLGPAARAADLDNEVRARDFETLFQQLVDSNPVRPVFADLGGGFHSMSIALPSEVADRLAEALADPDKAAKAQTLVVLAAGQQVSQPSNPSTLIHAALSNTTLPYNYWVTVLNLGGQNLSRKTTIAISGPKKLSRSASIGYGANSIWMVWYNPGVGVGTPGVYTLKATVDGGGTVTTKSFTVNP